jgi:hypothetical protein
VLISEKSAISITILPFHDDPPKMTSKKKIFEPIPKIVDHLLGCPVEPVKPVEPV